MNRKTLIVVLLLAFALGTVVDTGTEQKPDRPFLRLLAAAARIGLGLLVFEPPPHEAVHTGQDFIDHGRSL